MLTVGELRALIAGLEDNTPVCGLNSQGDLVSALAWLSEAEGEKVVVIDGN